MASLSKKVALVAVHPSLAARRVGYNVRRFVAGRLSSLGYYDYPHRIIFLAGMPLSATTWMKNMLARVPGYYSYRTPMPHEVSYRQDICDSAFSKTPPGAHALFKTHLNPTPENLACIRRHGVEKIVITHRDLRDVVVSRYHRIMEVPKPEDAYDFVDYRAMSREEALSHSVEVVERAYVPWILGWMREAERSPGRCHFTRFEDLRADPATELRKALEFYGIALSDQDVEMIVDACRGRRNSKRNFEDAKVLPYGYSSNFRSGKVGRWRKELLPEHVEKCRRLFGACLVRTGYEEDIESW